jgi:outer membrane lipase/esterase
VGITPLIRSQGNAAVAEAGRLTLAFNRGLDRVLERSASRRQGVRIYRIDVRDTAQRLLAEPAAYGFRDVTTPCHGGASCDTHLFWDSIHPTTRAHALLAQAALRALR